MKKNLIIFYPSFERGGVEKNLQNIITNFDRKINIFLISSLDKNKSNNLFKRKINLIKISNKNLFFLPSRFSSAFFAMISLFNIIKKIKSNLVVHSMQSNVAAAIVCFVLRKKIVIRNSEDPIYSTFYSENKFLSYLIFFLKILTYNFVSGIITNSKGSKKSLEKFVLNKNKIVSIYNPYLLKKNLKKFKKKKLLINIGRLRKQKDHLTLIRAFKIFSQKYNDYKLVILGDGNKKNQILDEIKSLKLDNKIKVLGWKSDTTKYLKKSKLFVLSSIYEGLGNVLIDAINFDVPCVSTDCHSGPREILLNGRGGYLVPINNYKILAKKMIYALDNYNLSLEKNKIAKKKLYRFTTSKQVLAYQSFLLSNFR